MQKTLKIINSLLEIGLINNYAIARGMAQFYYIDPSVTYDLDLIVHIPNEENILNPLSGLYEWAAKNGYTLENEHIIIEGIPVQFLLAYNDLVKEALGTVNEVTLFNEKTYILKPEYLMAIMLQTGRPIDKERFARFLIEADFDKELFLKIIERFGLSQLYRGFNGE